MSVLARPADSVGIISWLLCDCPGFHQGGGRQGGAGALLGLVWSRRELRGQLGRCAYLGEGLGSAALTQTQPVSHRQAGLLRRGLRPPASRAQALGASAPSGGRGRWLLAALPQLLRVDVSALELASSRLDSAVAICFGPVPPGHLLVSTSSHTVVVLDAASGRVVREVSPGLWSAAWLLFLSGFQLWYLQCLEESGGGGPWATCRSSEGAFSEKRGRRGFSHTGPLGASISLH